MATAPADLLEQEALALGQPLLSYEDIGEAAFGSGGRAFITWVLYTELIGTCALFFILEVGAARAVEEEAAGSAPPLDKEASAIAGHKYEGGEGLGGCGQRELCCGAAGAGKKKSWPSNLPHAVLRAL